MNEVDKYLCLDCVCGMRVLEEAGLAAADVECMNCSVRSFASFMFWIIMFEWTGSASEVRRNTCVLISSTTLNDMLMSARLF